METIFGSLFCVAISWFLLAILVGSMGASRQIGGFLSFVLALVFSPIIGLLFVIASDRKEPQSSSSSSNVQVINSKARKLLENGASKLAKRDFEGGLQLLLQAIHIQPDYALCHFNLACAYSLKMNKDKAFFHLQRAVECGFIKYSSIASDPDLTFLRSSPEYSNFVTAGYKIVKTTENVYDKIRSLGELKEKGLLSAEEFEREKAKLLGN